MSIYIGLKFNEIMSYNKQASGAIDKIKKLMAGGDEARVFTDSADQIPELRAWLQAQGLKNVEIVTFSSRRLEDYI
jgi:hypothetical protein